MVVMISWSRYPKQLPWEFNRDSPPRSGRCRCAAFGSLAGRGSWGYAVVSNSIPPRPVRLQGLGCRTSGIEFRVWVAQTVCLGACEPAFRCVMNTINPRTQAPGQSSFHFHVWERHGSRSQELVWERHILPCFPPSLAYRRKLLLLIVCKEVAKMAKCIPNPYITIDVAEAETGSPFLPQGFGLRV